MLVIPASVMLTLLVTLIIQFNCGQLDQRVNVNLL